MNNTAYTSYPREQEILLMDGIRVYVLAVEHDVVIDNDNDAFSFFNEKKVTIIHLFNCR